MSAARWACKRLPRYSARVENDAMIRRLAIPFILSAAAVAGMAISVYLTVVHYARVPLVCSTTGVVNCERVLSSFYSQVWGVPISVGGLLWFIVAAALALPALISRAEPAWLQPVQVLWSLLGLLTVIYLVGVEALALGVLCAWCTALHALILLTLVLSVVRTPGDPAPDR
jgi:uncharacterized membrane protein